MAKNKKQVLPSKNGFFKMANEKIISVLVKPNAMKNDFLGFDDNKKAYRVSIKAVPDKGKANAELIKFLKKHFKKRVEIVSGHTSRKKRIKLMS